jgi:enoyl-CoA hydratase/carnithine racemase
VQLEHEREGIAACAAHPDGEEGMRAFAAKRKPSFPR